LRIESAAASPDSDRLAQHSGEPMIIGLVQASVSIPHAQSLKDKRMVLKSLKDRIVNKMNVSVAEVGKQDTWKYSDLAFVTVAAESSVVQQRISELSTLLRSNPQYVLIDLHTELL
jgi:uncharacterized protein